MGKASMCIKMLQLLNSGKVYKVSELAELLETNPRNLVEYKKELEECGYYINSIPGRYGGYQLEKSTVIPSLKLTNDEKKALSESVGYIESRGEFLQKKEYEKAVGKIFSSMNCPETVEQPFIIPGYTFSMPNEEMLARYNAIDLCIRERRCIIIHFVSTDNVVREREVEPYKLIMSNNAWFVIGFCRLVHDYRLFKLTRIEKYEVTKDKFVPSKYFDYTEHFDKTGFKRVADWTTEEKTGREWVHVKLNLHGKPALYVKEYVFGQNQKVTPIDKDNTLLECDMQYEYNTIRLVLGFGEDCDVLEPSWLKDKVKEIAQRMAEKP